MTPTLRLRDVGSTYGGLVGKTKADFGRGDASFVTFLEVINSTRLRGRDLEPVRVASGERQNCIERGDLLFNGSSETPDEVALSAVVDFEPGPSTFLNSFCFGFRLRPGAQVVPTFLAYFFRASAGRSLVASLAQGATRYNIAKTKFLNIELAIPSVDRQYQIVERLSDADNLIAALGRMIAKKEAIKQGMMQQLLTGKTRLPGFSESWRPKRLEELLSYQQPTPFLVQTTQQLAAGRVPVVTAGKTFVLGYTNDDIGIYTDHPVIIFDDFTTSSQYVDFNFKAKSSAMKILSATTGNHPRFLFERMRLIDYPLGDHKRYWISEYSKQEVKMPGEREQHAIAEVVGDVEGELEDLRHRLKKAKDVKVGMMQELLTGRTRLPVKDGPA